MLFILYYSPFFHPDKPLITLFSNVQATNFCNSRWTARLVRYLQSWCKLRLLPETSILDTATFKYLPSKYSHTCNTNFIWNLTCILHFHKGLYWTHAWYTSEWLVLYRPRPQEPQDGPALKSGITETYAKRCNMSVVFYTLALCSYVVRMCLTHTWELAASSLAVSIRTNCCNNEVGSFPTHRIYMFRIITTINSHYSTTQYHRLVVITNTHCIFCEVRTEY